MVAVIIVAVVFTGLAAALFWAAPRGKLAPLSRAISSTGRGASATINLSLAIVVIVFGIAVPAYFIVWNRDRGSGGDGGVKLTAAETNGRQLFGEHCAYCHSLYAASAVSKTGPNLDQLRPSYQTILYTLANGCLPDPGPGQKSESCLGYGVMPAQIVQGRNAIEVAQFVSAVAGKH